MNGKVEVLISLYITKKWCYRTVFWMYELTFLAVGEKVLSRSQLLYPYLLCYYTFAHWKKNIWKTMLRNKNGLQYIHILHSVHLLFNWHNMYVYRNMYFLYIFITIAIASNQSTPLQIPNYKLHFRMFCFLYTILSHRWQSLLEAVITL